MNRIFSKVSFYNRGQSLIGIIIVLIVVGIVTGSLYLYLSKQLPEVAEITEKPAEEVVKPEEKITPPSEEELPEEEVPPEEEPTEIPEEEEPEITEPEITEPEIICQDECSQTGFKKCSDNSYQICGNYDEDNCLEWGSITNCPSNTICQNGNCIQQKCADGTLYGRCSTNKPKYCEEGNLINRCSICGCFSGQYCDESSRLCKIQEKLDMLIFISPQYANNTQIEQAINSYIEAVKADINWDTKIITLSQIQNDFRKIDEIIESYYSLDKIKAAIMVGEDIDTALYADLDYMEAPTVTPWTTLDEYTIEELGIKNEVQEIHVAISLLYPTSVLEYQKKVQQIVDVFLKFSKNRGKIYPKKSIVFTSSAGMHAREIDPRYKTYQIINNYSNLYYKEDPDQEEISSSLQEQYMIYFVGGHAGPNTVQPNAQDFTVNFWDNNLNSLSVPIFLASGCYPQGWFNDTGIDNNKLDPSANESWFGSKIFSNPELRAVVLGIPDNPHQMPSESDPRVYDVVNFIMAALPDLAAGKTLAESIIGDKFVNPGGHALIYGDPTFHYNF